MTTAHTSFRAAILLPLYLITQGKVMLELDVTPHSSVPFEALGPGDILGWAWLIPSYRWSFHAYALTSVEVIALSIECLRREAQGDLHFGFALLDRFARILLNRLEARSERRKLGGCKMLCFQEKELVMR